MPNILRSITRRINILRMEQLEFQLRAAERLEAIRVEWMTDTDYKRANLAAYASELGRWDRAGQPPAMVERYHPGKDHFLRCRAMAFIGSTVSSHAARCLELYHNSVPFSTDDLLRTIVEYRLLAELEEFVRRDAGVATTGFWEIANEHDRYGWFAKSVMRSGENPVRIATYRIGAQQEALHNRPFASCAVAVAMAAPKVPTADLQLIVYDPSGSLVARDTSVLAYPLVIWRPSDHRTHKIVVRNTGKQAAEFTLYAN